MTSLKTKQLYNKIYRNGISALTTDRTLILGHVRIGTAGKSHEIPAAQQLINELGMSGRLFTLDALHCQKNG